MMAGWLMRKCPKQDNQSTLPLEHPHTCSDSTMRTRLGVSIRTRLKLAIMAKGIHPLSSIYIKRRMKIK